MKERLHVNTKGAPAAFGPFSQAIKTDTLVFSSGQLPLDPISGELVDEDVAVQTHQVIKNLKAILDESRSSLNDVVKVTVFITSMDDFDTMNKIYATYFTRPFPARSCIEVPKLAKGAKVEIEAISLVNQA
jgi:2-iminobutanoate/2-iminopropanoate deaminase